MEVLPSSTPWANGEDTECPAVSLSAYESQKLLEEQKQSTQPRNGAASGAVSWLLWTMKVQLFISWSLHVLEVQQEKDDVQTSLQCFFFFL